LNNETLIERGLAAASLLSNTTFQSVIRDLCYEQFCVFQDTKPEDSKSREISYNLYQGLKAIEAELTTRVHQKDQVVAEIDAANEEAQLDFLDSDHNPIQGDNDQ
jgi:hypothetical protein